MAISVKPDNLVPAHLAVPPPPLAAAMSPPAATPPPDVTAADVAAADVAAATPPPAATRPFTNPYNEQRPLLPASMSPGTESESHLGRMWKAPPPSQMASYAARSDMASAAAGGGEEMGQGKEQNKRGRPTTRPQGMPRDAMLLFNQQRRSLKSAKEALLDQMWSDQMWSSSPSDAPPAPTPAPTPEFAAFLAAEAAAGATVPAPAPAPAPTPTGLHCSELQAAEVPLPAAGPTAAGVEPPAPSMMASSLEFAINAEVYFSTKAQQESTSPYPSP